MQMNLVGSFGMSWVSRRLRKMKPWDMLPAMYHELSKDESCVVLSGELAIRSSEAITKQYNPGTYEELIPKEKKKKKDEKELEDEKNERCGAFLRVTRR